MPNDHIVVTENDELRSKSRTQPMGWERINSIPD